MTEAELAKRKRRCNGTNKQGKPCGRPPIRGGFVCFKHGGATPQVQRKAKERLADLIDPDRVLREAAKIAYLDLAELFDEKGHLLPIQKIPADARAAIASVEVVRGNVDAGDGKFDDVVKLKTLDKVKALEMLAKHLQLFVERVEHTGGIVVKWKE